MDDAGNVGVDAAGRLVEVVQQVPMIGMSITGAVSEGRQVVFQTHLPADMEVKEANALVDKLMGFADRQEARYALPQIQAMIDKYQRAAEQYEKDRVDTEAAFVAKEAALNVQLATMQGEQTKVRDEGYADYLARGMKTEYVPKGATKMRIDGIGKEIDKVVDQLLALANEKLVALSGLETTRDANLRQVEALKLDYAAKAAQAEG